MRKGLLPVVLITCLTGASYAEPANGQEVLKKRISIAADQEEIKYILRQIGKKADVKFVYITSKIPDRSKTSLVANNEELGLVLYKLLYPFQIQFEVTGDQIVLKTVAQSNFASAPVNQIAGQRQEVQDPITGKITDDKGNVLSGVSITVKGTGKGTSTNTNGLFSIDASEGDILEFTMVGYKPYSVVIGGNHNLSVQMQIDAAGIGEVVVVAYGTQKKTSLTAAVSTLKGSQIANVPVASLSNAIGGRVPGVIFRQNSGEPGQDGATLLIRGAGTTGNAAPLIIVDGVPRSFGQIDPNSVASMSFLKDAAAVAPYGMAGANGVILVTTKKGNAGKPVLSYNGYYGIQNPTRLPDMVDAYEYVTMINAANTNANNPPVYTAAQVQKFKDGSDPDVYPNHNVLEELINDNTPMMSHSLSVAGGSEKIKYFGALSYFNQKGMWGPTRFQRYNLTSNVEAQATSTTKFYLSFNGRVEDKDYPAVSASSIFDQLYRTPPIAPVTFSNGLWGSYIGRSAYGNIFKSGFTNTLGQILLTQVSIEQQLPFIKGLSTKAVFSYDFNEPAGGNDRGTGKTWKTPIPYYAVDTTTNPYTYPRIGTDGPAKPSYSVSYFQSQAFTYQGFLNYNNRFGKSDVGASVILESRNTKTTFLSATRKNYNVTTPEISNGSFDATDISNSGYSDEARQRSVIFRATYGFDEKYLFEVSGRYDGHYAFGPGKRFGFFPAASVGWRVSEEDFMKNVSWIDNLKLRASYGESGGLPYIGGSLAAFQYLSAYSLYGNSAVMNNTGTQGLYETLEPNPNITWERARKTDIGLELSIFKGLFFIEADYFAEKRNNMLVSPQVLVPAEYGIGIAQENAAEMKNAGFEFMAGSNYNVSKDLRVGLTVNFTYAKNKLVQVFETTSTFNNPNRRITGRPLGTQFGYNALGLFQQSDDKNSNGIIEASEYDVAQFGTLRPGDIRYEDVNGDKKITPDDFKAIGNPTTPQIIYGFSPSISFKGFDLNLLFQGAASRHFYINGQAAWPFSNNGSALRATMDYWTPDNTDAKYPRLTRQPTSNNTQTSSWWIRKGSYLRMKSIDLGYTLPSKFLASIKIQSVRAFVSGQNLLTWSKEIKDFDPEISANNGNYYPQQSVVSAGFNIIF